MTDEKVQSALTQFMVWASLTQDMEMQKGKWEKLYNAMLSLLFLCLLNWPSLLLMFTLPIHIDRELCDSENDLPWGIQMCMVSPVTAYDEFPPPLLLISCIWLTSYFVPHHTNAFLAFSTGWHILLQTNPSYTANFTLRSFHLGPQKQAAPSSINDSHVWKEEGGA